MRKVKFLRYYMAPGQLHNSEECGKEILKLLHPRSRYINNQNKNNARKEIESGHPRVFDPFEK